MRNVLWSVLVALAAATASALPADAGPRQGGFLLAQGAPERLLPLDVILSNIARQIPGRHLDAAGPFPRGGRWIYRIKWLTPDGRVLIVIADAQTGQILDVR